MSRHDSEQSSRTVEIEEGSTFQCTQCRSLRGNQSDHSHGLRVKSTRSSLQSTRSILTEPRNQSPLSRLGKYVSPGCVGVLSRSSEKTPGNSDQRVEGKRHVVDEDLQ